MAGFFNFTPATKNKPMKTVLPFLADLAENNNREWFNDNKSRYETAKTEVESFVADLLDRIGKWDETVRDLKPKDCTYRIYRDVRFGKDKSPYKTSMGALVGRGGRKSKWAINYVHIEPGKSFVAGGSYMPEPAALKAIRQEIDYNFTEFEGIITAKDFVKQYGGLETEWKGKLPPKGYAADNPAIEYLKNKSFIGSHKFTDKQIENPGFVTEAEKMLLSIKPLNDFINRALGGLEE
jgi:uncharacterized protein (TIGR02453 family)